MLIITLMVRSYFTRNLLNPNELFSVQLHRVPAILQAVVYTTKRNEDNAAWMRLNARFDAISLGVRHLVALVSLVGCYPGSLNFKHDWNPLGAITRSLEYTPINASASRDNILCTRVSSRLYALIQRETLAPPAWSATFPETIMVSAASTHVRTRTLTHGRQRTRPSSHGSIILQHACDSRVHMQSDVRSSSCISLATVQLCSCSRRHRDPYRLLRTIFRR